MQRATVGWRGESPLWPERCESYKIGMASQRRERLGQVLKTEGIVHQMDFIGNTYTSARKSGLYNDTELAQWVLDTKSSKRATKREEWYQEMILGIKSMGLVYLLLVGNRKF